jgi:DNA (cytosine-5)-methyltransferase 3A
MGINVLSLFDGMSCGQIALNKARIDYDKYFASEIKEIGIKVTQHNYPNTIQLGDITKITANLLPEIDLLMGGSPCQNLSMAMVKEQRKGLEGSKSSLFYEYYRLLKEVNPTYFLLENVGGMSKKDEGIITTLLGVKPLRINSKLLSPQLRNRLYWTNIPNISQIEEIKCDLNSILVNGWSDREKARCLLESDSRPVTNPLKMFHRYYAKGFNTVVFKDENHYNNCVLHYEENFKGLSAAQIDKKVGEDNIYCGVYSGLRYLYREELELLQTVPVGYTAILNRNEAAGLLGDGWTVDVIAHLFKGLKVTY